jgi:tetratricopeptide (TPR) repeat protein
MVPGACFLLLCQADPHLKSWRGRWLTPVYYSIALLGYFFLRRHAFHVDRGVEFTNKVVNHVVETATQPALASQPEASTLFDLVNTLLKASGFYFTKLLQPLPLNFAIHRIESYYIVPGGILLLLLVWLAWRRKLVGWLIIVSASIAVSALFVVLTGLSWTPLAERYMYIPCGVLMVGLVSGSAMGLRKMAMDRLGVIMVPLLIMFSGWVTANRNIVWQDNLTLYQDTVQKSPDFAPAVNELALALKAHNRHEEANQLLSVNQMPVGDNAAINEAVYYWEQGDYPAAREHLVQLLDVAPGHQQTRILEKLVQITTQYLVDIDNDTLKQNGYMDILGWLERITAISTTGFNYYRIGRVNLILGDKNAAQKAFAKAAELFPEDSLYKKPAEKLARDLAK